MPSRGLANRKINRAPLPSGARCEILLRLVLVIREIKVCNFTGRKLLIQRLDSKWAGYESLKQLRFVFAILQTFEEHRARPRKCVADLGLPDAKELLKSQIAISIANRIEQEGWTRTQTTRRLGINPSKVTNLLRGRLADFSVETFS